MKYTLLLFTLGILSFGTRLSAAEPTIPPSAMVVNFVGCAAVDISWTNGNGAMNLFLIKEGSKIDALPIDTVVYKGQNCNYYGTGSEIGTGNYVCSNSYDNHIVITQLKSNTKYYIAIFTHNNYDYLTSKYYVDSFTTLDAGLHMSVTYSDSCQNTNKVRLINQSTRNIPNATYFWRIHTSALTGSYIDVLKDTVDYVWTKPGDMKVELWVKNIDVCYENILDTVHIYLRAYPNPALVSGDTLQCLKAGLNSFSFTDNIASDPSPLGSYVREWYDDNELMGTSPNLTRSFKNPGVHTIKLVGIGQYNGKRKCRDTASLKVRVLPDPDPYLGRDTMINKTQSLVLYPGKFTKYTWYNGSKKDSLTVQGSQLNTGKNNIWVKVVDTNGCSATDTMNIGLLVPNLGVNAVQLTPTWTVGPIPAETVLWLKPGSNFNYHYQLFNAEYKLIMENSQNGDTVLDARTLSPGLYFLRLEAGGMVKTWAIPVISRP